MEKIKLIESCIKDTKEMQKQFNDGEGNVILEYNTKTLENINDFLIKTIKDRIEHCKHMNEYCLQSGRDNRAWINGQIELEDLLEELVGKEKEHE